MPLVLFTNAPCWIATFVGARALVPKVPVYGVRAQVFDRGTARIHYSPVVGPEEAFVLVRMISVHCLASNPNACDDA